MLMGVRRVSFTFLSYELELYSLEKSAKGIAEMLFLGRLFWDVFFNYSLFL